MKCNRCGGSGIFYTRVVNMQPIKAKPDDGMCYRCHGSGVDPYLIDEADVLDIIDVNHIYNKTELIELIMGNYNKTRRAVCYILNNMYKDNKIVIDNNGIRFTLRD